MKLFRPTSEMVTGIDIGTHALKLVEVTGSLSAPNITAYGMEVLEHGAFSDNEIVKPEVIQHSLERLMQSSGAKAKQVAVSISSSHAITKVLGMPNDMNEFELEEQVSIEALHFIPYPIDEVNIDFQVLGPSKTNKDENDVLLVACRRSIVNDYIDLIESAGFELKYVDIDTYAIERVCHASPHIIKDKTSLPTVVFDVGSANSHLVVLDKERVLYSRHQKFGAAQLIKLIRREYGLDVKEAEKMLFSSDWPDDFVKVVRGPFADMLCQELNRALQFFYSSSSFSDVDRVYLTGACSSMQDLVGDVGEKLRMKVRSLHPLKKTHIKSKHKDKIAQMESALTLAYGLSLRGLK